MATQEPTLPRNAVEKENYKRLIVIIEGALLETVKTGKAFQLLNCDDHLSVLRKNKRDLNEARPDITHQCLLNLLDSPLNKAGLLQIFIRTAKNVLIEVNPKCRIPRTFKRFSGLMVQLLHQMTIKANDGSRETLLRLIKNPVTDHLPVGIRIVGTSVQAEKLVNVNEWAASLPPDQSIAVVIGGIAVGNIDVDYTSEEVAISSYPLSAAGVCAKFCSAFEQHWGVL